MENMSECPRKASTARFDDAEPAKAIRTTPALSPFPASNAATRAYFRSLRAAEMATWELSGGDYLRSNFVKPWI